MNTAKNYTIRILNDQYTIESDDSDGFVLSAAQRVDTIMREIMEKNKYIDQKRATLLAALRLAGQLVQTEQQLNDIKHIEQKLIATVDSVC